MSRGGTTDMQGRSQNLCHFYPSIIIWIFSHNQNNRGSSGACVTYIYCGLSVKTNDRKTLYSMRRSLGTFVLRSFWRAWSAKIWRSPIWAHDWRRHYTGRYTRYGISILYLCVGPKVYCLWSSFIPTLNISKNCCCTKWNLWLREYIRCCIVLMFAYQMLIF